MEPQIKTPVDVERHIIYNVTPLSKYLSMALFIVLPFLGGWIGYSLAPEKVLEVEKVVMVKTNTADNYSGTVLPQQVEKNVDAEVILFPKSQELLLDLPDEWSVETGTIMGGSVEITNYYFFDEKGRMAFKLNYPIREIGYEPTSAQNKRTLLTEAGLELSVVDRIVNDDVSTGFVHYTSMGDDFWQDSFEIFIPFGEGLYTLTATEKQPGRSVETRYQSYQEYTEGQAFYAISMDSAIAGIAKVKPADTE